MKKDKSILVHIDESTRQLMDTVNSLLVSGVSDQVLMIRDSVDDKSEELSHQLKKMSRLIEEFSENINTLLNDDISFQLSSVSQTLESELKNVFFKLEEIDKLRVITNSLQSFSDKTQLIDIEQIQDAIATKLLSLNDLINNLSENLKKEAERITSETSLVITSSVNSQAQQISNKLQLYNNQNNDMLSQLSENIVVMREVLSETIREFDEKTPSIISDLKNTLLDVFNKQSSVITDNHSSYLSVLEISLKESLDSTVLLNEVIDISKTDLIDKIDKLYFEFNDKGQKFSENITEYHKKIVERISFSITDSRHSIEGLLSEIENLQKSSDERYTKNEIAFQNVKEAVNELEEKQQNSFELISSQVASLSKRFDKLEERLIRQENNTQNRFNIIDNMIESVNGTLLKIAYLVTPFWKRKKMNKDED